MSQPQLMDPEERDAFKKGQPGLRRDLEDQPSFDLSPRQPGDELRAVCARRRTHRHFSRRPVPVANLSRLLGCLRQVGDEPAPRFLYPSAGGLYPVQVYLHLRPGRVESLPAGTYYYQPVEHGLVALETGVDLDVGIHVPLINQPVFQEAAFSLFLVAELAAIAPMYGEQSLDFVALECGYLSQLLMLHAPDCGVGLCPIGTLELDGIRGLFALGDSQILIHSHLGGVLQEAGEGAREEGVL